MGGDPHDRTMKHSLVLITAGLVLAGAACASDDDARRAYHHRRGVHDVRPAGDFATDAAH